MANILVAEDEFIVVMELLSLMEEAGHVVLGPVTTARQALDLIENSPVDVALLDAALGDDSAEPVVRTLRARGIPFAIISGHPEAGLRGWLGDAHFFDKPFDPALVLAAIEKMLQPG